MPKACPYILRGRTSRTSTTSSLRDSACFPYSIRGFGRCAPVTHGS
ncbi:MAG: hypothetical protein K2K84_09275 [Muribaculaceae bacterium]|nr:hypothetical protein [Muribaculaceae bacterium]